MAMVLAETKDMSREEWLEQRRKGIGGSDIAAILGMSPFGSPITVYQDKIGELPPIEENESMYWGNILEDIVAKEFQRRTGLKVRRRNAILRHPEYPFLFANVDRLIVGKRQGLECKTTSEYMKKEWKPGEEVPPQYLLQCQWYMAITGFKKWHIAVLIGGNKFHYDLIERDDELIEMMISQAVHFWTEHVEKRVPPPMDGSEASERFLKYLYPESSEDTEIILSNSFTEQLEKYDQLKEQKKEIDYQIREIENKIKAEMEENEKAIVGERVITWKSHKRTGFDRKGLQKKHPDIYAQFVTESTARPLKIK